MYAVRRCVIVSGADIGRYDIIKQYFRDDDFFVFCDCGLRHKEKLEVPAHLVVGDFDSYKLSDFGTETIVLPCEKDDTDTVFAVKEGIKRGFGEFLVVGAIGGRLDHTLGNVYILDMLDEAGKRGMIADDHSEMVMISERTEYLDGGFSYFSLINVTGKAEGITIKNAKYSLENAEIRTSFQYGISNEVIPGKTAEVRVGKGKLLLIKIRR